MQEQPTNQANNQTMKPQINNHKQRSIRFTKQKHDQEVINKLIVRD